jgi:hypothetical protein
MDATMSRDSHVVSAARGMYALAAVTNFRDDELLIPRAIILGAAESVEEEFLDRISVDNWPKPDLLRDRQRKKRNGFLY